MLGGIHSSRPQLLDDILSCWRLSLDDTCDKSWRRHNRCWTTTLAAAAAAALSSSAAESVSSIYPSQGLELQVDARTL
ncbi:hypothetical protein ACFX13_035756 [Malus domestica]